jgi:hypothetical protein
VPTSDNDLQQRSIPVPDPTTLTTDAVNRATDVFRRELIAQRQLIEQRLDAMDKATELLARTVDRVPSETDKAIAALRDVLEQRSGSYQRDLLTAAEDRERIRMELRAKATALRELVEQRLNSMDEATKVLAASVDKFPTDLDRAVNGMRELLTSEILRVGAVAEEKFTAVETKFQSNALALTAALAAQEKAVSAALEASGKAVDKAEIATEKRFASVNEFRAQQADTIARFLTRNEYSAAHTNVTDAITELRSQLDSLSGTVVPRNETDAWRTVLSTKVDDGVRGLTERIAALELRLTSRLDTSAGQLTGAASNSLEARETRNEQRLSQGAVVSLVVGVIIGLGLIVSTLALIVHK